MRLWWITATALIVFIYFGCFFGQSEATESGYVQAKDFRSNQQSSSSENKVTIRRRVLRRKLDLASSENANATVSVTVSTSKEGPEGSSSEDSSLPKSTTFVQARRALFNRLNRPLLKNRSLDTTISKLRSRLGAVDSTESTTTKKPRFFKKVLKKQTTTPASPEDSSEEPIAIKVPTEKPSKIVNNDSMIMIPVPESQRKPYQPVIMQVTKSNESSTAAPETKVVTYKLNKMFVPMGIYGKVVGNVEDNSTDTQLSQESGGGNNKGPEIRHKGTQSESNEKTTGVKVTDSSSSEEEDGEQKQQNWDQLLKEIKSKGKKIRKPKEHSRIADTIDITYNYRPKYDEISLTTEKTDPYKISLTTEKPEIAPNNLDENGNRRASTAWSGSSNQKSGSMTRMTPPAGQIKQSPQATSGPMAYLDTLKQTVSNIPGLFHKGFTSLTSLTNSYNENPFHDDTFTSASEIRQSVKSPYNNNHKYNPNIVASIPGGYIPSKKPVLGALSPSSSLSEYETLEYFRNRPYLLGRQQKFKEPKSISGFKPVAAPAHMAQEYFGSTPTTPNPNFGSSRQTDSWASGSGSRETVLRASPSSWQAVGSSEGEVESKMVPTEELHSSWKDYLFRSSEFGNEPASSGRSWREFLGFAPSIDSSNMMSSTFGSGGNYPMLDGGRRRSMILDNHWKDITSKYTMQEIDEAKTKIHKMFSGGPSSRSFEEHGGGAFDDLMKIFKLWFNVGTGRSIEPMKKFDHIKSESSRQRSSSEDSWRPVSKAGGKPLISFSAGISFPTKQSPGPAIRGLGGSHYNASPRPYIPHKFNKGLSNHITTLAHNYAGPTKPTSYSEIGKDSHYTSYSVEGDSPLMSSSYGQLISDDISGGDHLSEDSYSVAAGSDASVVTKPSSNYGSSHFVKGSSLNDLTLGSSDPLKESASSFVSTSSFPRSDDDESPYELVPSDVYFNQKNPNLGEIAAVVKPAGVSDEVVKAHLPPQVAGLPTLNYPSHLLDKNPQHGFNSLNQLQQYLSTGDETKSPSALSLSHKQRADLYKVKEQSFMLPQKYYDAKYASVQQTSSTPYINYPVKEISSASSSAFQGIQQQNSFQNLQLQQLQQQQQIQQLQQQQLHQQQTQQFLQQAQQIQQPFVQYNQIQQQQQPAQQIIQQNRLKTSGDSGVGFSDFELPSNLDPDIAALLKSELDKDDVPEEIRKEFQEAKKEEEEKARKQQAIAAASSSIISSRLSPVQQQVNKIPQTPPTQSNIISNSNRRSDFIAQQTPGGIFAQSTMRQQFTNPFQQNNNLRNNNFQSRPSYPLFHFNQNQRQLSPFAFLNSHNNNNAYHQQRRPMIASGSHHRPQQVLSKFFAPIPINPTVVSQTLKGRYQSPVPRYVVELAKKLQRDKDVQGIVRVSTKRGHGPPVEYLYPVRG